jgi:hypothetical protein
MEDEKDFSIFIDEEAYNDLQKVVRKEILEDKRTRKEAKKALNGLINVTGLFRHLQESMFYWHAEGFVELVLTNEKESGYSTYQHARTIPDDKRLYMKTDCDEIRGIDHYYVWQTTGCCEDDYSGFILFPLKDGRYYKFWYSC